MLLLFFLLMLLDSELVSRVAPLMLCVLLLNVLLLYMLLVAVVLIQILLALVTLLATSQFLEVAS